MRICATSVKKKREKENEVTTTNMEGASFRRRVSYPSLRSNGMPTSSRDRSSRRSQHSAE